MLRARSVPGPHGWDKPAGALCPGVVPKNAERRKGLRHEEMESGRRFRKKHMKKPLHAGTWRDFEAREIYKSPVWEDYSTFQDKAQ